MMAYGTTCLSRFMTRVMGGCRLRARFAPFIVWGKYQHDREDRIWTKYTGQSGPYGLRDPKIDEKRVLFFCGIDRIATFGEP